ncbi:MAG: cyclic nucleotide-binding domain-containing protein [Alphaproteobacteria bacterium]|nr:cyclic nucleotide-binding domain-containing protein [Rhodospirillales bacterium]MCW9044965.1 cyclic nucleotide-binding domain-containing protein [Alphaproteobacteria bacterium]
MSSKSASRLLSDDDLALVCKSPTFVELPEEDVERLMAGASARTMPRHTLLFSQGDAADRFYVVLEGKVKLFTAMESGDEGVVEIVEPVHTFAEAAMFASGRFPVNAEVVESSVLVQVSAEPFFRELSQNTVLAFKIMAAMSRRHRRLLRQISDLKLKSPGQRLGSFLLSLTEKLEGRAQVKLPFDKTLIASHVGMKPESLSRAMARLRDIGVICERRNVDINDINALRIFCGEE